jgi:hypothetical protein
VRQRIHVRDSGLYVLPDPGTVTDPRVQLALMWRNHATLTGRCPACGGRGPNRAERRRLAREGRDKVTTAAFRHEPECPAADEQIVALIRAREEGA